MEWLNNKDHTTSRRVIVWEVTKNPRVMFRKLKAFLAVTTVNVHESTIRRQSMVCMAELRRRWHINLLPVERPEDDWRNVEWTDETNIKLFSLDEKCFI